MLLNDAVVAFNSVGKILEKEIPISLAFRLQKVFEALKGDVTMFYAARQKLIEQNSTKASDTEFKLTPEQQDFVNKEIDSMLGSSISFPEELKIPMNMIENISLEGNAALGLKAILKE